MQSDWWKGLALTAAQSGWLDQNRGQWAVARLGSAVGRLPPSLVQGLDAKVGEAALSMDRIMPLVSELDFARDLADAGWTVVLLSDNDRRFGSGPSPDLEISRGAFRMFVEVARLEDTHGYLRVLKQVNVLLRERRSPLRVDVKFGPELSAPLAGRRDPARLVFERTEQSFLNEFAELLRCEDDTLVGTTRRPTGAVVTFHRSDTAGWWHAGTAMDWVPPKHQEYALHRLAQKAEKQAKFPSDLRSVPFVVALDAQMPPYNSPHKFRAALYGSMCHHGTACPRPAGLHERRITAARARGWAPLFDRVGFADHAAVRADDTGRYFTEFEDVAGLLVRVSERLYWQPNPFSQWSHQDASLLDAFEYHLCELVQ